MSALKFKSKISVPGIECSGEIKSSVVSADSVTIQDVLTSSEVRTEELYTNNICQQDTTKSVKIDSTSGAPVVANYLQSSIITLPGSRGSSIITPDGVTTQQINFAEDLWLTTTHFPSESERSLKVFSDQNGRLEKIVTEGNISTTVNANQITCQPKVSSWLCVKSNPQWDGRGEPVYWIFTLSNKNRVEKFSLPVGKALVCREVSDSTEWKIIVETQETFNTQDETAGYMNDLSIWVLLRPQNISEALDSSLSMAQQKTLLYACWSRWDIPDIQNKCSGLLLGSRPIYGNEFNIFYNGTNAKNNTHYLGNVPHVASLMVRTTNAGDGAWGDSHRTYPCWVETENGKLKVTILNRAMEGQSNLSRFGYPTEPYDEVLTLECKIVDNGPSLI